MDTFDRTNRIQTDYTDIHRDWINAATGDRDNPNPLTDLLALSHVPRWSILPISRPQSVADHTFRVMVICMDICDRLGFSSQLSGLVLQWALVHDGDESRTGDIPSSYKRAVPMDSYPSMCPWYEKTEIEVWDSYWGKVIAYVVKLADRIEAVTFLDQWGQGSHADHVQGKLTLSIPDYCGNLARAINAISSQGWEMDAGTQHTHHFELGDGLHAHLFTLAQDILHAIYTEAGRRTDPK